MRDWCDPAGRLARRRVDATQRRRDETELSGPRDVWHLRGRRRRAGQRPDACRGMAAGVPASRERFRPATGVPTSGRRRSDGHEVPRFLGSARRPVPGIPFASKPKSLTPPLANPCVDGASSIHPPRSRTRSRGTFAPLTPHIRKVVDGYPVDRTTVCGRSGTDRQQFVSLDARTAFRPRPQRQTADL